MRLPARKLFLVGVATVVAFGPALGASAQSEAGPGRGTGRSSVAAARLQVGSLVDVRLVDMSSTATLDAARQGLARNLAAGDLRVARVKLGSVETAFPTSPFRVERSERDPGRQRESFGRTSIAVPGDLPVSAIGAANEDVAELVNGIVGQVSGAVGNGTVANGVVKPVELEAVFDAGVARYLGGSSVERLEALGGLFSLDGLSVAEHGAWAEGDVTGAVARALSVKSLTVLDTGAVFRLLGLDAAEIPLATLAKLADRLGLPVKGKVGSTDLSEFDSWSDVQQSVRDARQVVDDAVDAGKACDTLRGATGALLDTLKVVDESCTEVADALERLTDDLLDVLVNLVEGAPLLSVRDLGASVQTATAVSPGGEALTSAQASGSVGKVLVGNVNVGEVVADLAEGSLSALQAQWNELQGTVNDKLDTLLGTLDDDYEGLIEVQAVPAFVQKTGIDGNYAVAEATVSLLRVVVKLPAVLPEPVDLGDIGSKPPTTTVPTLPPTTLPTLPPTTLPTLPPTTLPPTTLPPTTLPIASVRGAVEPLARSAVIEVGVLEARSEHTRPGVEITTGGENRTYNPTTGFGAPGSLPATGLESGVVTVLAVLMVSGAWLLKRQARRLAARSASS